MGLSHHYPIIIAIKPYKSIDFIWDGMHHSVRACPPQFPHLPTYPLSVAAPKQWWASSTPQKRSDLKMDVFFVAARVSWGDLIVEYCCWL